jgi:hypothetical protein
MFASRWRVLAFGALVLVALGAASQAPASFNAEVGKEVVINFTDGTRLSQEDLRAMVQTLTQGQGPIKVELQVRIEPEQNNNSFTISLWGDTVALDSIERTLRDAFPQLATAQIRVQPVTGTVRSNLMGVVTEKLFHKGMTQAELDAARAEIISRLRAQGIDGDLDVQLEDDGSSQKVKVRATKVRQQP